MGFGLIARDPAGVLVQAKANMYQGLITPEIAEPITIKEALNWIDSMQWQEVAGSYIGI